MVVYGDKAEIDGQVTINGMLWTGKIEPAWSHYFEHVPEPRQLDFSTQSASEGNKCNSNSNSESGVDAAAAALRNF